VLAGVKIIAEAWDAAGLYQLGQFPRFGRWAEWNGRFRDDVRRFARGDHGMVPLLAQRLAGSPDLYRNGPGRCPSVNFVTCHDGFTLADLVSFDGKRNLANGEEGRDGADENFSWNCGVEGATTDAAVLALRRRQVRNLLAILLLSRGVPMLRAGDEFGNTQGGNNNPWCQDNATGWMQWRATAEGEGLERFLRELIRLRASTPALRCGEVAFHGVALGAPDFSHPSRTLAAHFTGGGEREVYAAFNAWEQPLDFELPGGAEGGWKRVADTALASPADIASPGEAVPVPKARLTVAPFSIAILVRP
jgi:glycogen operon protein